MHEFMHAEHRTRSDFDEQIDESNYTLYELREYSVRSTEHYDSTEALTKTKGVTNRTCNHLHTNTLYN